MLLALLFALSSLMVTQANGSTIFVVGGRAWVGEPLGNGSYVLMSVNSSGATIGLLTNGSLRIIYFIPSPSAQQGLTAPLSPPLNESSSVYAFTNASSDFYLRLFTVNKVSNGELTGPSRNVTYLGYPPYSVDFGSGINCSTTYISISFPSPPQVIPLPVYVNAGPSITKVTGRITLVSTVPSVPIEVLGPDYVVVPLAPVRSALYSVQVCSPVNASLGPINDLIQGLRFSGRYSYSISVPYANPITGVPAYRTGWCSDYAIYAAHALEEEGLSAEVAVGYIIQNGRASGLDYHAWLEAFVDGDGWIDAEVTPPSLTAAGGAGGVGGVLIGLVVSIPSLLALIVAFMDRVGWHR
ncbi:transglutaminase-like domain-containing protein [Thermocladium modestius]|uniref:transglutaminase-like domain-containing protein n=1 Tax=Thermocladium modestius TaxID=62609 RepID=UPI001663C5D8|nr:transglutaminase-like domain-containing protein [Thermocladium modestius]